jgi:hypothetical protein
MAMRRRPHPETGVARQRALDTLFELLVVTVLLGTLLNALVSHLGLVPEVGPLWWAWLVFFLVAIPTLLYLGIRWDDQRQWDDTRMGLLLPYVVSERSGRIALGRRRSYPVTNDALEAWNARYGDGAPTLESGGGSFAHRVMERHMELVHHLLMAHLARFGRRCDPDQAVHSWLRLLDLPLGHIGWERLPPLARGNPFSEAIGSARPERLCLPKGTRLEVFGEGPIMLRLTWGPAHRWTLRQLMGLGPFLPGGEVRVRWLAPLSEVSRHDRQYHHMTARLNDVGGDVATRVVVTRLLVEVRTQWNVLRSVERFRDWAINLADYLASRMDYETWRRYYLERTVDDLDWKVGWISKGREPGLAERMRRMDRRLARLEEHLWPDEPPSGGSDRTWLSGRGDE